MSRIARTLTLVVVAAGSVLLPTTAAFAQVPRPLPAGDSSSGPGSVPVTVVTGGSTGLAAWAIVLIVVGSVAFVAAIAAAYRSTRRHHKTSALATA